MMPGWWCRIRFTPTCTSSTRAPRPWPATRPTGVGSPLPVGFSLLLLFSFFPFFLSSTPARQRTDERGIVRVWHAHEVVQGVYFKLKSEKPALAGAVLDLAWSPDSTKIVAVGHGRDKYGEVFDMETGSS